uniref:Purinergic receptor P2Y14 n=1 Tax=Cynoglossus semilaevis TaxID=244447 RepID=A0A3P8WDI7_CYNSE
MDLLNSTHLSTNKSDFSSTFTRQLLPPLYFVACIVGLGLNGVAAWIFFRVPSDSGLVVYLKNMVVADLLMLSTFPFKLASQLGLGGWRLHVVICRYIAVLFYTSMLGGLSALHLLQSVGFARVSALLTWCLLLFCALPNIILTSQPANEENARHCMQLKTPLGVQWHRVSTLFIVALFWLTLLVLAFCYSSIAHLIYQTYRRMKHNNSSICRKSNSRIFSILAVFFICFVPYHVCRIPYTLSQMPGSGFSQDSRVLLFQLKEGTLFLSALNVCLDPVIYILMCRKFRDSLLNKLPGQNRRRSLTGAQSLSNI